MPRWRISLRCLCFALIGFAVTTQDVAIAKVNVKLTATNSVDAERKSSTATFGVPFAKGAVKDLKKLSVRAEGKPIPAQFLPLAKWQDGTVRWALVDCQINVAAKGKSELTIQDDGQSTKPAHAVTVSKDGKNVRVATGPLEFTIDTSKSPLFDSIVVDGKPRITSAGRGLVLTTMDGKSVVASPPESVTIEQAGPMRATICLKGKYPGVHDDLLGYTVRVTAFAGRRDLKLRVWLENNGQHGYAPKDGKYKPNWFHFDGMAVELGLDLGNTITASCEGVKAAEHFKVFQRCKNADKHPEPAYGYGRMEYSITSGTEPLKTGDRTDGVVVLRGSNAAMTTAIRHFWQNYEKAIELDDKTLSLWLFPRDGLYPRAFFQHACPGFASVMIQPLRVKDGYNLPGSVHKSSEIILDFSGQDAAVASADLSEPLFPLASAEYYASTDASPGMFTPPDVRTGDDECDAKLDAWMRMTRSVADRDSPSSIWNARQGRNHPGNVFDFGYWYGWMDFGDLAVPGRGTASLHYDWPWITATNLMRTGDTRFLQLATEMVRHRVEIDQQWSDQALPEFRGFQRADYTYAQFHCARFTQNQPSASKTWLAGLVLNYMLTGDMKTLEAINRGSKAMVVAWKGLVISKDYYVRRTRSNMQFVGRAIFAFCAMYDLTGDQVWLDRATSLFDTCVIPKWESVGPHLHLANQVGSQDYERDDIEYCYSIQALCELHHRTGNEKLFELLKAGCDTDFPENFFDAPLFLANLNAYVAMVTGEEDYADNAIEFWIEGFPESKSPPVYLPNNSQWSRRKAMFMRTGHLLQAYYWKKATEPFPGGEKTGT